MFSDWKSEESSFYLISLVKMALSESRTTNQKKLTASNDAVEECSICYDPFTNKAFASDCLHNFCYQCIYTWVQVCSQRFCISFMFL